MYKKILVPLDGTPLAEAALSHAQALAKSDDAELILLRVAVTPDLDFYHRNEGEGRMISNSIKKEALEYMKEEVARLRKDGVKASVVMRDGPVSDTIVEVAEEARADVIAMSTHGRVGVQRLLKGSVAEEVVHASRVPVLLIHPN